MTLNDFDEIVRIVDIFSKQLDMARIGLPLTLTLSSVGLMAVALLPYTWIWKNMQKHGWKSEMAKTVCFNMVW